MEDQPAKMSKEKKKGKAEKNKLKVEGDIRQPDESFEVDADTGSVASEQRAHRAVSVTPADSGAAAAAAAAAVEPTAQEASAVINSENVREEMKKFKEQLLQSLAENECSEGVPQTRRLAEAEAEAAEESVAEAREALALRRERSASRPYEVPAPAPPAPCLQLDVDEAKLAELKEAFLLFDLDGDGCISAADLRGTLLSLGEQVDDTYVRNMISEATNPLDFEAFVSLLGRRGVELDPEETLVDALAQWDQTGSGLISEERIRHDLVTWGDRFSEREASWALEEAPTVQKRGHTLIDYVRFCKLLGGLRKATKKFNQ